MDAKILSGREPARDIAAERPLIVDPVNPANNVAGSFDWSAFQVIAKKMLRSPATFVTELEQHAELPH